MYDTNGNMDSRSDGSTTTTLDYDVENRLVSTSNPTASFVYNGDGTRVKGTIGGTTTVYIGNYYEWTGSTSTMKSYYYAGGTRVAVRDGNSTGTDDLYWLLADHLGSTSLTTNASGTKTAEVRYKAWGEDRYTWGTTPTTMKYTGQREESLLGLYFYNARWYDPALGRFIQADTDVPASQGIQAWDRYAYVNNSPINFIDPTGHFLVVPFVITVAVIVVGWIVTAPPVYAPASEAEQVDLAEMAEARWQTKVGKWIDDHPIAYCALVTFCVHGAYGLVGTVVEATNDIPPARSDDNTLEDLVGTSEYSSAPTGSTGKYKSPFGYPDLSEQPGEGFEWRTENPEQSPPGSNRGGWHNPSTDEYFHYDPNEKRYGPHIDYRDPTGVEWRIYPDGSMSPK